MLILSIIHLSLPLQVPTLKAELYFSYTSAQLHASFLSLAFKLRQAFVEILMEALNHFAVEGEPALAISCN